MNRTIAMPEIRKVVDAVRYKPAISIILPFDPKMEAKSEITIRLKDAAKQVEKSLLNKYPSEIVFLMMEKLNLLFNHLNYSTHKKSVAIYLSPVFEKVLYLDIPVDEKIKVASSFEIRDLLYAKKEVYQYLLLVINEKDSKMYVGDVSGGVRILSHTSQSLVAFQNESLRQIDTSLGIILKAYQLPLFVMGSAKILDHFKKLTNHKYSVIDYIYGNFEKAHLEDLKQILEPYINDWAKVKETALINQLEKAAGSHNLVTGINDVSAHHQGHLLVVEKNFVPKTYKSKYKHLPNPSITRLVKYSKIKDAVDDIIEKVLENGGDVELVEDGVLRNYQKIALIK